MAKEIGADEFDDFISEGNAIIDFFAEWCGPCKMMSPIIDELSKELKGKVKFAKVNIENAPELAERFMVMSVPTLIFFKKGEQVDVAHGAKSKEELVKMIKSVF